MKLILVILCGALLSGVKGQYDYTPPQRRVMLPPQGDTYGPPNHTPGKPHGPSEEELETPEAAGGDEGGQGPSLDTAYGTAAPFPPAQEQGPQGYQQQQAPQGFQHQQKRPAFVANPAPVSVSSGNGGYQGQGQSHSAPASTYQGYQQNQGHSNSHHAPAANHHQGYQHQNQGSSNPAPSSHQGYQQQQQQGQSHFAPRPQHHSQSAIASNHQGYQQNQGPSNSHGAPARIQHQGYQQHQPQEQSQNAPASNHHQGYQHQERPSHFSPPSNQGYQHQSQGPSQSAAQGYQPQHQEEQEQEAEEAYTPKVFRHVYVHTAPDDEEERQSRVIRVPGGDKHVNIIFVKAPSSSSSHQTELILPEQDEHKNLVYVLLKKGSSTSDVKIRKPANKTPKKPEVYFIRYNTEKKGEEQGGYQGDGGHGNGKDNQQTGHKPASNYGLPQ